MRVVVTMSTIPIYVINLIILFTSSWSLGSLARGLCEEVPLRLFLIGHVSDQLLELLVAFSVVAVIFVVVA